MTRNACTLARSGHGAGVWDYPYPVFLSAIDELNEAADAPGT